MERKFTPGKQFAKILVNLVRLYSFPEIPKNAVPLAFIKGSFRKFKSEFSITQILTYLLVFFFPSQLQTLENCRYTCIYRCREFHLRFPDPLTEMFRTPCRKKIQQQSTMVFVFCYSVCSILREKDDKELFIHVEFVLGDDSSFLCTFGQNIIQQFPFNPNGPRTKYQKSILALFDPFNRLFAVSTDVQQLLSALGAFIEAGGSLKFRTVCFITYQQRATFLIVYPPPPRTNMGRLKVFAYCTHSLQPIKTRHNYFV